MARFKVRRPKADDDDEYWEDDEAGDGSDAMDSLATTVFEQKRETRQFSGILNADGEPIFRLSQPKPGIGFTCRALDDYDPDVYYYAVPPFEERDFLAEPEEEPDDAVTD